MPLMSPGCCRGDQRANGDYIPAFGSPMYVEPVSVPISPIDFMVIQDKRWWEVEHCIPVWLIILLIIISYYVGKNR